MCSGVATVVYAVCSQSLPGDWKCGSGKVGSKSQGWKMQELGCCMGSQNTALMWGRQDM